MIRMLLGPWLLAALLSSVCASAWAQSHTVVASPTHDCAKSPNASVEANNGTFKLTGTCGSVLVKGSGNTLAIEAARRIEVTGPNNVIDVTAVDVARLHSDGNKFRYRRGIARPNADVVAHGDNNSIVQGN